MGSDITATERVAFDRLLTIADVDCRKGPGRLVLRHARALSSDLGGELSTAQMMLVQRASLLAMLCGHTEAGIMLGRPVSVSDYLQMTATLRRLLTTLSPTLKRQARDTRSTTHASSTRLRHEHHRCHRRSAGFRQAFPRRYLERMARLPSARCLRCR